MAFMLRSCSEILALLLLSLATSQVVEAFKSQVQHALVVEGNPIRKVVSMMEKMAPGHGDMIGSQRPLPRRRRLKRRERRRRSSMRSLSGGSPIQLTLSNGMTWGANQVLLQEDLGRTGKEH